MGDRQNVSDEYPVPEAAADRRHPYRRAYEIDRVGRFNHWWDRHRLIITALWMFLALPVVKKIWEGMTRLDGVYRQMHVLTNLRCYDVATGRYDAEIAAAMGLDCEAFNRRLRSRSQPLPRHRPGEVPMGDTGP